MSKPTRFIQVGTSIFAGDGPAVITCHNNTQTELVIATLRSLDALTGELCAMAQDQDVYFPDPLKRLLQRAFTTLAKIEGGAK